MNKLEKWLRDNSDSIKMSLSTNSIYYKIGNAIIRVSDHTGHNDNSYNLSIIKPSNNYKRYIVCTSSCAKFYLWNCNEIIEFIPQLVTYLNLNSSKESGNSFDGIINYKSKVKSKLISEGNKSFGSVIYHPSNIIWNNDEIKLLPSALEYDLNLENVSLDIYFKDFLSRTPCKYSTVLNLYKILYVDNKHIENIDKDLISKVYEHLC